MHQFEEEKGQGGANKDEKLRNLMYLPPIELVHYFKQLEENEKLEIFLQEALKDESFRAYLSYYEKWFETFMKPENKKLVENIIESQGQEVLDILNDLPLGLEQKFTSEELFVVFSNLKVMQPTFGCKANCDFCGFDAPRGVRDYIPYGQLNSMLSQYGEVIRTAPNKENFLPYYASDLGDYLDTTSSKTGADVLSLLKKYLEEEAIEVLTRKVPSEELANELRGLRNVRLSTLGLSEKQKEARNITTSKLRDKGIPIETQSSYYKAINAGLNFKEGDSNRGIGCIDGLMLTPRGLYNVLQTTFGNKRFPQAQIIIPFEGFELKEKHCEIEKGLDIRAYLNHGIVLCRLKIEKNENNVFLLYDNVLHKINYDDEGIIMNVSKYDLKDIEQSKGESEVEYVTRLRAALKTCESFEERKIFSGEIGEKLINLMKNNGISPDLISEFCDQHEVCNHIDLSAIEFLNDEEVKNIIKSIMRPEVIAAMEKREEETRELSKPLVFLAIVLTKIASSHPHILKKIIESDESIKKIFKKCTFAPKYYRNIRCTHFIKTLQAAIKDNLEDI